jgi:hypothetical protein
MDLRLLIEETERGEADTLIEIGHESESIRRTAITSLRQLVFIRGFVLTARQAIRLTGLFIRGRAPAPPYSR